MKNMCSLSKILEIIDIFQSSQKYQQQPKNVTFQVTPFKFEILSKTWHLLNIFSFTFTLQYIIANSINLVIFLTEVTIWVVLERSYYCLGGLDWTTTNSLVIYSLVFLVKFIEHLLVLISTFKIQNQIS